MDQDQLDFFGNEDLSAAEPSDFRGEEPTTIARRVRTLLLTGPIHALHRNKALRPDIRDLDVRTLALLALDLAIEGMGLDRGITRRELIAKLAALAPLFVGTEPDTRFTAACEYVVDGLPNAPRSEAFREEYLALQEKPVITRDFEFRLLQEEEREGHVVIRASTFGINLYLRMLDTEVEDAQVATEAMLEDQLRRGAIDRAAQSAHQAKLLSMSLEEKIEGMLHRLRRDVRQVDFLADLKPELDQARAHLERRTTRSADLLEAVEERLDDARGESARSLAQLRNTLQDCRARHDRLAQKVISATRSFLDEQERQSFRRARSGALPSMDADVMRAALKETSATIEQIAPQIVALFHPPSPTPVLSFTYLIDSFFEARRQQSTMRAEVDEAPSELVNSPLQRWTSEERRTILEWLGEAASHAGAAGIALSRLLHDATEQGIELPWRHLMVLEVMRLLEVHDAETNVPEKLTAIPSGSVFKDEWFAGDDLLLRAVEHAG